VRFPLAWTGLLIFALVLALLEWVAAGRVSWLAPRMVIVAAAGYGLFRVIPWTRLLGTVPPQSWIFRRLLFFVFLSHFARVLIQETSRLYIAWRLTAPRQFGPGGFRSLAHATVSLFPRTLQRAERFYAALLMRERAV